MTSEATAGQTPDIYGQVHPTETSHLIDAKLKQLEAEVEKLPVDSKKCLLEARQRAPGLVNEAAALVFLRCEVFNADLAAARLANYWQKRVKLFGPEKAFQPLALEGALSEDITALSTGVINITGQFDPQGRAIVYVDPSKQDKSKYSRESMCRAFWYVMHAALEHESAQRHGVVILSFPNKASFSQLDRKLMGQITDSLKRCIPVRMAGFHICHPPSFFAVVFPVLKLFLGERLRKRLRVHFGSQHKVLLSLEEFGLTKDVVPEPLGGEVGVDVAAWLASRRTAGL